jgi:hypothetical protein
LKTIAVAVTAAVIKVAAKHCPHLHFQPVFLLTLHAKKEATALLK